VLSLLLTLANHKQVSLDLLIPSLALMGVSPALDFGANRSKMTAAWTSHGKAYSAECGRPCPAQGNLYIHGVNHALRINENLGRRQGTSGGDRGKGDRPRDDPLWPY
jgi:hypothetical protein